MELPLQISFRGMEASPAVEAKIRERVDKLAQQDPGIVSCRVVVEEPHRHHHQGRLFHVRVDLTLPGAELVVNREPGEHHAHEDVFVAVRDAFDAMRRQVQDHPEANDGACSKLQPLLGIQDQEEVRAVAQGKQPHSPKEDVEALGQRRAWSV